MYSGGGGGGAEGGPRTRAQRRARRRGAEKRQRADPDHRGQRARKRRRLQESRYAEDASDEEEDVEEAEEVHELPSVIACTCIHLNQRNSILYCSFQTTRGTCNCLFIVSFSWICSVIMCNASASRSLCKWYNQSVADVLSPCCASCKLTCALAWFYCHSKERQLRPQLLIVAGVCWPRRAAAPS